MSASKFAKPLSSDPGEKKRIAIVSSRYNPELSDELLSRTLDELRKFPDVAEPLILRVPGAWEIPLALQRLARCNPRPHAIIVLGVIWRGATSHAEIIAGETARACMKIALSEDVPVVHQILHVSSEEEALERISGPLNRPAEIASTAREMAFFPKTIRWTSGS